MTLSGASIRLQLNGTQVIDDVTFEVPTGALTALVGPNGAGKSTLLRLISGAQKPDSGAVVLDGADLTRMAPRDRARRVALVEQDARSEFSLTVRQAVGLGRIPYQSVWSGTEHDDGRIVAGAVQSARVGHLLDRHMTTLSGGEQQRVHLARALAQSPEMMLLDEPTNHLDIEAQLHTLGLLGDLGAQGMTVVAALHDLNLAVSFCDHVVVMAHGAVRAAGPIADVVTAELVEEVYRVRADLVTHPRTGRTVIAFS